MGNTVCTPECRSCGDSGAKVDQSTAPVKGHAGCLHGIEGKEVDADWNYGKGGHGEHNWSFIKSGAWKIAKEGKQQSPIDIKSASAHSDIKVGNLDCKYAVDTEASLINNGHTAQVNWQGGHVLMNEKKFHLKQLHFHVHSEHKLDGKVYDMEMHLVHVSEHDRIAMVGILFEAKDGQADNPFLQQLVEHLPSVQDGKEHKLDAFNVTDLKLDASQYYRYTGSLTTPPCTEGVLWAILAKPIPCSKTQLAAFAKAIKIKADDCEGNFRKTVHELNDRKVTLTEPSTGQQPTSATAPPTGATAPPTASPAVTDPAPAQSTASTSTTGAE